MKCKRLVVDTAAFVKNVPLWEYGEELYSLPEVIEEIRDKQTRQRLEAMPIAIKMRQPQAHSVRFVNEFSKKTGDYASLSLADIKVLALAYELEVEVQGGSEHLRSEPQRIITEGAAKKNSKSSIKLTEGFYHPAAQDEEESPFSVQKDEDGTTQSEQKDEEGTTQSEQKDEEGTTQSEQKDDGSTQSVQKDDSLLPSDLKMFSQLDQKVDETSPGLDPLEHTPVDLSSLSLLEHTVAENCSEDESNEEGLVVSHLAEEGEDQEEHEEDNDNLDDGSDDEGWITPSNIKKHKIKNSDFVNADEELQDNIQVACITADFAVQNVLKHIGLPIMGVDGKFIRHLRTYILRCYACFRTTSVMTKIFCPHCGNKTLKKVSVTVNPDGTQKIWINTKRPINIKGTKYSLPTPKGGKHGRNPILVEDQREAKRFSSKMSWNKINPLHEDYNPDQMPFAVRDVYSRAAQLGYIAGKNHHHYYWERKNPNQPMRRTGKKKKENNE